MSSPVRSYGVRQSKVTPAAVAHAADALFHSGTAPTVRNVRERLGGGALSTLTPLLRAWWQALPERVSRAALALDRRAQVAPLLEALWLEALEAAARRAHTAAASVAAPPRRDQPPCAKARKGPPTRDREPEVTRLEHDLKECKRRWREECARRRAADRQADRLRAELLRFLRATMIAPAPKRATPRSAVARATSARKPARSSARPTTRPAASRKPKARRTD